MGNSSGGYFGDRRLCWTENWVCNFLHATHWNQPNVTTDWTHWLGEVTRTSELNQVKLFLIGTILQQICVYLPNSCLWTYVSNDANDAGFQFINFFPHKKALTNVFHREYWDPDHEAKSRPTSQCRFCNQPLFCTIVSLVTRYIHAKLNCADINQSGHSGTLIQV